MKSLKNSNLILALGILASALFWCLDAAVDVYFFGDEDESLLESIFSPNAHELYMRGIVLILFLITSLVARSLLIQQESIAHELEKHKNNLQGLVEMRTEQLEKLATIDDLTQIYNRRQFFELARYEIIRNDRHQHPLSVIMLDIDFLSVLMTFMAIRQAIKHCNFCRLLLRILFELQIYLAGLVVKSLHWFCLRQTS